MTHLKPMGGVRATSQARAPTADAACSVRSTEVVDVPRVTTLPLSSEERARLANVIPGSSMPIVSSGVLSDPGGSGSSTPLTVDELERIRVWIAQGAVIDACPSCAP